MQFTHLQSFYDRALVRLHSSGTWEFRRAHVPGVGQRLMDHPSISVASFLRPHAQANLRNKHSYLLGYALLVRFDRCPAWRYGSTAFRDRFAVITLWVNKTFSELGQVRLASPDWREEPEVTSTCSRISVT